MKIAVLGLGFMGSTHLKALANLPQAELVAVASDDARQLSGDLSGVQGNIGGPGGMMDFSGVAAYRDWREAVHDPRAEAVDVCLPTNLHAPAAIAALHAGKHVLVEKPMALDAASADAMLEAARRSGRVLMVAQVLRFFPMYRAMADVVKSGRLGTVRAASFRRRCAAPSWSPWLLDPAVSGGAVLDLLVHDVDMCLHLFGPPEAVSAVGSADLARGIDWIASHFHYPGTLVSISGGWHPSGAYPFSMEYSMVADGGAVEYSSAGVPPTLYAKDGSRMELPLDEKDGYQAEVEYFVQCCVEESQPVLCPPVESAQAVKLAGLMLESREKRGERIAWKSE
jgi:predicted dehydrogenase